jgi:hypothetical protein
VYALYRRYSNLALVYLPGKDVLEVKRGLRS